MLFFVFIFSLIIHLKEKAHFSGNFLFSSRFSLFLCFFFLWFGQHFHLVILANLSLFKRYDKRIQSKRMESNIEWTFPIKIGTRLVGNFPIQLFLIQLLIVGEFWREFGGRRAAERCIGKVSWHEFYRHVEQRDILPIINFSSNRYLIFISREKIVAPPSVYLLLPLLFAFLL